MDKLESLNVSCKWFTFISRGQQRIYSHNLQLWWKVLLIPWYSRPGHSLFIEFKWGFPQINICENMPVFLIILIIIFFPVCVIKRFTFLHNHLHRNDNGWMSKLDLATSDWFEFISKIQQFCTHFTCYSFKRTVKRCFPFCIGEFLELWIVSN